jgi:type II secretory pathway pseudopilin PulG
VRAVNLIPADLRGGSSRSASRSQGGAYVVLGLLAGLALLALLYGVARHQVASRQSQTATLAAKAQRAQVAAEQLAPYTSFIALREQRTQAVTQLVDSRFDWAHALHEFGRVLPAGASISSLSGTVGSTSGTGAGSSSSPSATAASSTTTATSTGASAAPAAPGAAGAASVTSATPPGSLPMFTATGCATSQAEVALTLERMRLIDGASAATLQSSVEGSGAAGSSGTGGCPGRDEAFTIQVSFDPLPSESATAASFAKLTTTAGGTR